MNISDFQFFRQLSTAEELSLSESTKRFEFSRDQTIIAKGTCINHVYFIVSGRVKDTATTRSGKEIVFNTLTAGDCFGIVSPSSTKEAQSDFIALEETEVYAVCVNEFIRLMRANATVSELRALAVRPLSLTSYSAAAVPKV